MQLAEFLEQSADLSPSKVAIACADRRATFSEIDNCANRLANALIEAGLGRQDRAAVYLENSIESVVSLFAVLKADAVFIMINPQVKAEKLAYILIDCQAKALVTDSKHLPAVLEAATRCNDLTTIIAVDEGKVGVANWPGKGSRLSSYADIMDRYPPSRPPRFSIDIDLASLVYTSGTTGNPKGVMLTHLNMVSAATSITQYLENTADDVIIDVLPLSFDYGLYQILMSFKCRATVILEKSFVFPYQVIDRIVREKVTGFPLVPTIAAILLTLRSLEKQDFSRLRYVTSTGQVLPPQHIRRLRQVFPSTKIYSMYGLTECKRVAYLPPEEIDRRPSSVGKAMPNVETYLVDQEGKQIKSAWEPGELVVRGSNVMRGYWNLQEATDRVLRPGRYPGERVLYTGDVFERDNDGYLYFKGRKDDMFKSAGELVSPTEVERVLCSSEDVLEAAVIGMEDNILGKAIRAYVVLRPGSRCSEGDIIRFCAGRMESYMVPKSVVLLQELPKTASGKIEKINLK